MHTYLISLCLCWCRSIELGSHFVLRPRCQSSPTPMLYSFKWQWFLNCPQDIADGIVSPLWLQDLWSYYSVQLPQTTSNILVWCHVLSEFMWYGSHTFTHDDVIKWKHFPRYWPSVAPVNSPHKGQWRGALMFSLICVRINGWVNKREAGDLRRYRAHYDVIVMR